MCAQPDPNVRPKRQISPIQWLGLAVLVVLFLYQSGFLGTGSGGIQASLLQRLPQVIALILGITVHEFSHGLVATWFGDDVPRRAGRLTLNPLKHLDPLGTLLIFTGPIGWGRPMPINPAGMRNPNLGWALSSAAGPISNLIVATVTTAFLTILGPSLGPEATRFVIAIILLNVALAVFNLVPLPPLDGFGFIFGLSPQPVKQLLAPVWQFGPLILLALLFLPSLVPGVPAILPRAIGTVENFVLGLLGFV